MANLTLVVEDQLLRDARKLAIDQNTSVNQMVREFLEQTVGQTAARTEARKRLMALSLPIGPIDWKREDLYER